MKQHNKIALGISGVAMAAGIVIGITPFVESTLSRLANRAEAVKDGVIMADLGGRVAASGLGTAPGLLRPGLSSEDPFGPGRAPAISTAELTQPDTPDASAPRFTVTDLNALPGGEKFQPAALNNSGTVIGNWRSLEPSGFIRREMDRREVAIRFKVSAKPGILRNGKIERLPTLPEHAWTFASDINDDGTVVGAARPIEEITLMRPGNQEIPPPRVVRWVKGQLEDISDPFYHLRGMIDDVETTHFDPENGDRVLVNNDGTIFLGARNLYRWQHGNVQRFQAGLVRRVNNQGMMAGMVPTPNATARNEQGFAVTQLPTSGSNFSQPGLLDTQTGEVTALGRYSDEPYAISDSGLVVLRGYRSGSITQFSLWKEGETTPLATLPQSRQCFINNSGWVVMGDGIRDGKRTVREAGKVLGPFLWTGEKYYRLLDLLPNPDAWLLSEVVALNDRNQIVLYAFRDGDREKRALLLTPVSSKK